MASYAIGDIQGCFETLQALLQHIHFNPKQDTLWLVGDLVNRGPQSLETLRFLKNLGSQAKIVLGNHDIHLLCVYFGAKDLYADDTIQDVLAASDCKDLITWLRQQPLVYSEATSPYIMVHAGLCPSWTFQQAHALSNEFSLMLKSEDIATHLSNLYGNHPDIWSDTLTGDTRLRLIKNYCTLMRFCSPEGHLMMSEKRALVHCPEGAVPWFKLKRNIHNPIIFGHWSALGGETHTPDIFALDTGVVWGGPLTAMRLSDGQRFRVMPHLHDKATLSN